MEKKLNKKVCIVFIIFFFLVLFQHKFLWLFYDDYGYASLSYLPHYTGKIGMDTNIHDILNFLSYHYQNWGGRVLYFLIEIVLLKLGLPFYRLFQSIVITLIFYIIYKIITKKNKEHDWLIALFCVLCYGIFEIMIIRGGLFWITASILYVVPILPFLIFIYEYDDNISIFKYILCLFLVFISTWSQEQISVLVVAYVGLYTLHKMYDAKKINKRDIIMVLFALLGFLILMLSPGSSVRASTDVDFYNLSIFGKIMKNVPEIISNNFGIYNKIFSLVFFCSMIYISFMNKSSKIKNISIISNIIILLFSSIKNEGYFIYLLSINNTNVFKIFIYLLFFLQFLLIFINFIKYFNDRKEYIYIYLFIGSILSQACMVVAPYFPGRSVTMFEIICFIIFTYIFKEIKNNKKINYKYILIPFAFICCFNYISIVSGYMKNNDEKTYNDNKLREVSKKIKNGEIIKKVKLKKQEDLTYGIEEAYVEGFDSIAYYMKIYYDLPNEIELIYE